MSTREEGAKTIRRWGATILATVALSLVVVLIAAPGAHAQVPNPFGVSLATSGSGELTAADLSCVQDTVTLTNTGQSPIPQQHTIAVTTSGLGSAWELRSGPDDTYDLPAGESADFTVQICPLEGVEDGDTTGLTITAVVQSDVSNPPAQDELRFTITATDDSLFGLEVPNSALWIALAGVAALVALVLLTRSRAAGGVAISCPEASKTVAPGRGTSFPIRIRNDGRGKDVVSLSTTPVPPGWDTFLPLVDIPLEPREEQTVWLSVKSPDDAESGDHLVVKVTARSSSAAGEQATIDTLTTVRAPQTKSSPPPPAQRESSVYAQEADEDDDNLVEAEERPVAVKRRKQ